MPLSLVYDILFRGMSCLFSAVEHAFDAIEIQCVDSDRAEFQVCITYFFDRQSDCPK